MGSKIGRPLHAEWDDLFSYDTVKWVSVRNRYLGMIYYFFLSIILLYTAYSFVVEEQYLDSEKTNGWILIKVTNEQMSDLGIRWDIYDRITNPGEQGAVFIPTRIVVTKGQSQNMDSPDSGYCESPLHPCQSATDCEPPHKPGAHHGPQDGMLKKECVNGHCMKRQWCPAEDHTASTSTTHYLDFSKVELWLSTYVHFHKFQLDVATTDEQEEELYPLPRANTYPMHDLLRMANLEPEEVVENGAVIIANALLNCDLDTGLCRSKVEPVNVDTKSGFNYAYNRIYYENGVRKRDVLRMYGIRIICFATGFGQKTTVSQIILQISAGLALMMIATTVTDKVLLFILPERGHYKAKKIMQTEDFNED